MLLTTDSPFLTASPGDFNQDTILPSVIVELSAGMNTSFTAHLLTHRFWLGFLDTDMGAPAHPAASFMLCMLALQNSSNDFLDFNRDQ